RFSRDWSSDVCSPDLIRCRMDRCRARIVTADPPNGGRARTPRRRRRVRIVTSVREAENLSDSFSAHAQRGVPMTYTPDAIRSIRLSTLRLPLPTPISDAKVFTGRQKPMTEVAFLIAEIETARGFSGHGFSYSKRAGGPAQYAHAREVAGVAIGEDPNDIAKLYDKLLWAGASV